MGKYVSEDMKFQNLQTQIRNILLGMNPEKIKTIPGLLERARGLLGSLYADQREEAAAWIEERATEFENAKSRAKAAAAVQDVNRRIGIMSTPEYKGMVAKQKELDSIREGHRRNQALAGGGRVVMSSLNVAGISDAKGMKPIAQEIAKHLQPERAKSLVSYLREAIGRGVGETTSVGARVYALPHGGSWGLYRDLANEIVRDYGKTKSEALIQYIESELSAEVERKAYIQSITS